MSLAGLIDAALDDPVLTTVVSAAGRPGARPLALSGPAALGPLAIATLAGRTGRTVLALIRGVVEAEGTCALVATHDPVVVALADRAVRISDGHLLAKIKVGSEPHGLAIWPQPGRYSLGHTGILR